MSLDTNINFEVAFLELPQPVVGIWKSLFGYLTEIHRAPTSFWLSQIAGHEERYHTTQKLKVSGSDVSRLIVERGLRGFRVDAGLSPTEITYWLRDAKELGSQSTLRSQIDTEASSPAKWNSLIQEVMSRNICVGAWQWNMLYDAWQNASELHAYYTKSYGELPPGVRRFVTRSVDGIGPDREFIDVSGNPGRCWQLLPHLTFYPSAEMWLGPHFWQFAKCTKDDVLAADFFIEKRDTPHFLYLKCWPEAFTRPDGEQGRMQQRLWKLFFDEDCEWPPGSGTISDEPVYGPRSLTPPLPDSK